MTSNYPSGVPSADGSDQFPETGFTDATEPALVGVDEPLTTTSGSTTDATGGSGSTKEAIGEQASNLAHGAGEAGAQVAHTAKEETKRVAAEAGTQVRGIVTTVGSELRSQAATQQTRVAQGLRSVGSELTNMANGSATPNPGMATDLVNQAADRVNSVARWLDDRDPGSLLEEVKRFARQRPGVFIGIAAGAGILAGRLTRALATPADASESTGTAGYASGPAAYEPTSSYDTYDTTTAYDTTGTSGLTTTTGTTGVVSAAGVTGGGIPAGTSDLGLGLDDDLTSDGKLR
ncbi:MAG: hypothetical protein JWQ68_2021 [Cryobacterium sp.]|nr:hypothetical protein [Cryobacterium sp.]